MILINFDFYHQIEIDTKFLKRNYLIKFTKKILIQINSMSIQIKYLLLIKITPK